MSSESTENNQDPDLKDMSVPPQGTPSVEETSTQATPPVNEADDLIMESMRRLDGLLKVIRDTSIKPLPISSPALKEASPNAQIVQLMQEKLDAMGDKITDRLTTLLSELKYTVGPAREAKIQEINEIAGPEIIDISKLFDQKVASNIEEIGIEEKEAKEVDKSLEKLRKLRGGT